MSSRKLWLTALGVLSAFCAALFGASYHLHTAAYHLLHPPQKLSVDGRAAPLSGSLEAWLLKLPNDCCLGDKLLSSGSDHLPVSAYRLGFRMDVPRTLKRAELAIPKSGWLERGLGVVAPKPAWPTIQAAYQFDKAAARKELEVLAPRWARAPVDAHLDIARHRRIDDRPGRELDVDATLATLEASLDAEVIELQFRSIPAHIKSEDLVDVDVTRVLSSFETDFRKKAGARAVNIRRAAELLSGTLLEPGEVFSFNRAVGDRTERNGFTWAPVIVNDEMEPGLGGGVCQVATTLHAAAVLGGLEVKERRSHSRPSGYAPLGLDATVIYGEVDLKLSNPYTVPVMVHAFLPQEFVIRVELLGVERPGPIEHRYAVVERRDFYRRIVESDELDVGQFERTQEGGYGYDVISYVEATNPDGDSFTKRYSSTYYPVPEVYKVGPGTPESDLPELPEGATHMELAGMLAEQRSGDFHGVEVPAN